MECSREVRDINVFNPHITPAEFKQLSTSSIHLQFSGRLRLHSLTLHGPREAQGPRWRLCFQSQGFVLGLGQRMYHRHMHVEVVGLFKPPAALVTGEVQLSLCFMFGHVVLEGRSLPALEPTDLTPGGQRQVR